MTRTIYWAGGGFTTTSILSYAERTRVVSKCIECFEHDDMRTADASLNVTTQGATLQLMPNAAQLPEKCRVYYLTASEWRAVLQCTRR